MNNSDSYANKDDVASATWSNPHWAQVGGYPYLSVPQNTHPGLVSATGYPSIVGSHVPDFNATDNATFSLAPTTGTGEFVNLPAQVDFTNQNFLDPWFMLALSFDANSAVSQPQLVGDPYLAGVAPTNSMTTTPDSGVSPTSTTSTPENMWGWPSDSLQSSCTTPASTPGNGSETGLAVPDHGTNLFKDMTSPAAWDASVFSWPTPVASSHVASNATTIYAPTTAPGKRRREAEEPQGDGGLVGINVPPQKRARGKSSGILKGKRSTAKTRHSLVARIPEAQTNSKPKEAGRGAERLATPNAHGIYHQSVLGPSFQQGWAVEAADGKLTWVEGSVDEEAAHRIDSTVQQQEDEAAEPFVIPRKLKPMHKLLLQASEADFARRAVQKIKCRLCPDSELKTFELFKRHCDTAETHPLKKKLKFCKRCGDFFARCDSLRRHEEETECDKVTPVEAAEKERVTKEVQVNFIRRLRNSLMMGEDVGMGFSQIIKERYPGSSKKLKDGSTKRSRLKRR